MASNPASILGKSPFSYRSASFSCNSSPYFPTSVKIRLNPVRKVCSFGTFLHSTSSLNYGPNLMFRQLGSFCVFSTSNNGGSGGGSSGYNGGSDGGDSGDGSDGGDKKWSFLSWYLSLLEKYPVWTKAITSAFLTFIGDITCQLAVDRVSSLDWKRTFLFTLLGLALVGPTLHFWYLYLSKLVTTPGGSGAFLRLLLDQFIFSPIFIGFFLSTLVTLEGRPAQVIPKLKQEWFSSVVANWQLWVPFQFLNFRFVPQQFQVLAANFIALIWNVILSYKAHKEVIAK